MNKFLILFVLFLSSNFASANEYTNVKCNDGELTCTLIVGFRDPNPPFWSVHAPFEADREVRQVCVGLKSSEEVNVGDTIFTTFRFEDSQTNPKSSVRKIDRYVIDMVDQLNNVSKTKSIELDNYFDVGYLEYEIAAPKSLLDSEEDKSLLVTAACI